MTRADEKPRSQRLTGRAIVYSVLANYVGVGVATTVGFFLTPYMIHTVGRDSYGVFALSLAMLNYASLLDFGIGLSVMKLIADRAHHPDRTEIRHIVSTTLIVYASLGVAIVGIGLALMPVLETHFHFAHRELATFRWCYLFCTASVGLTFPLAIFTAVITGHGEFAFQNRFIVAQALLSAIGTLVLLELGFGVIWIAGFGLALTVTLFIVKVAVVRTRYQIGFSRTHVRWSMMRRVAGFAGWVFVINVAAAMIFDTDAIVVGALLGPVAVTAYQIALSPSTMLRTFGEQFNGVTLAASSSLQAQNDARGVQRLFVESTRVTTVVMLPFAIVFAAWGRDFIRLWVGAGFLKSAPALVLLTSAMILIAIQGTAYQVIMAYSRHKVSAIATVCEAFANLGLSIVLGIRYGITGVALGTLIPTTLTALGVSLPYAVRLTRARPAQIASAIAIPVGQAVVLTFLCSAITRDAPFTSMVWLLGAAVLVFVVFVGVNLLLLSGERRTYLGMITRRLPLALGHPSEEGVA